MLADSFKIGARVLKLFEDVCDLLFGQFCVHNFIAVDEIVDGVGATAHLIDLLSYFLPTYCRTVTPQLVNQLVDLILLWLHS